MEIGFWSYYLFAVNVIGFLLYLLNMWLYDHTAEGNVDKLLTTVSLLCGSLGILIAILLFDRKCVKENMMSRVFVICVFIMQLVVVLFLNGPHGKELTLDFWVFFEKHKILIVYFVIINFVSFAVYAIDKIRAVEGRWRIRIVTLLGLAFIGGSVGAISAMYLLRHKTSIDYFTVGVPLIMVMQVVVLFFLMNL